MTVSSTPPTFAAERDFDAARLTLLRRRFRVFAAVVGSIVILFAVSARLLALGSDGSTAPRRALRTILLLNVLVGVIICLVPYLRARRLATRGMRELSLRAGAIVVLAVLSQVASASATAAALTASWRALGFAGSVGRGLPLLRLLIAVHMAAALIVPWSPRDAARPILVIALVSIIMLPFTGDPAADIVAGIVLVLLAGAPGVLISAFRERQYGCRPLHHRLRRQTRRDFLHDAAHGGREARAGHAPE